MQKQVLKKLLSGLLLVFWGFTAGATPAEAQKTKKLKIELGETFRKDAVRIYLDKKLVYDKQLTTPDSVLITDLVLVNKPKKAFTVTVEINGDRFEQSSPKNLQELNDDDYSLLINYNRETEEVDIKTKTVIVIYD